MSAGSAPCACLGLGHWDSALLCFREEVHREGAGNIV